MIQIIVNSDALRRAIEKAFEVNVHCIKPYYQISYNGYLNFETKEYQSDISLSCAFTQKSDKNDVVKFKPLQMSKFLEFLSKVKEQPILVTFENNNVRVEDFVIIF